MDEELFHSTKTYMNNYTFHRDEVFFLKKFRQRTISIELLLTMPSYLVHTRVIHRAA